MSSCFNSIYHFAVSNNPLALLLRIPGCCLLLCLQPRPCSCSKHSSRMFVPQLWLSNPWDRRPEKTDLLTYSGLGPVTIPVFISIFKKIKRWKNGTLDSSIKSQIYAWRLKVSIKPQKKRSGFWNIRSSSSFGLSVSFFQHPVYLLSKRIFTVALDKVESNIKELLLAVVLRALFL